MAAGHCTGSGGVVNGYSHWEWGRGWVGGGVMVRGPGNVVDVVIILSHP